MEDLATESQAIVLPLAFLNLTPPVQSGVKEYPPALERVQEKYSGEPDFMIEGEAVKESTDGLWANEKSGIEKSATKSK